MLKSLRKSECQKEITEIINEAIDRQVIFIIWQSNRGKDNFIKTGLILKKYQEDIQVEVHDYHSQNSFLEEESLSLGDFIYFRSSFYKLTFKASFISNSDDNSFWVKIPEEVLLVEKREHPRTPLNSYNWKSSEFEIIEKKFIPKDQFPIPDQWDEWTKEEEREEETFDPLIENFEDFSPKESGLDEPNPSSTKPSSKPTTESQSLSLSKSGKMTGSIIEISRKGATLLTSQYPNTPFGKDQVLHFYSIEGVPISSPPLEGVVKSLRSGQFQDKESRPNEPEIMQLGLEFNQFIDI
ncbi:MAG: hypothetical protein CME68_02780 [Halobacteriovoraceae bacterium]|nr:hypothetical protein [Halobacteriovoraceae bacterium]